VTFRDLKRKKRTDEKNDASKWFKVRNLIVPKEEEEEEEEEEEN